MSTDLTMYRIFHILSNNYGFSILGPTLSQVSDYRLLGASSILSFYYYYRVDTSASPVPPWYHLPSSQCFSTDMVYYIYLLLKFTDLK